MFNRSIGTGSKKREAPTSTTNTQAKMKHESLLNSSRIWMSTANKDQNVVLNTTSIFIDKLYLNNYYDHVSIVK